MFKNTKINIALLVGRNEVGVGNEGFLKSMIPHHFRAILVWGRTMDYSRRRAWWDPKAEGSR